MICSMVDYQGQIIVSRGAQLNEPWQLPNGMNGLASRVSSLLEESDSHQAGKDTCVTVTARPWKHQRKKAGNIRSSTSTQETR